MRRRMPPLAALLSLALPFSPACGGDDGDDGGGADGGTGDVATYSLSGTVVDFATGEAIDGSATVTTDGLSPAPAISVTGADFTITEIPPHSVFYVLGGAPPDYRSTYSASVEVLEADVSGVSAEILSEDYIAALEGEFGVEPAGGTTLLLARAVDEAGDPRAGIPASAFQLNDAAPASGPYFLDADRQPDGGLTETSASGYVVFFDVEPGQISVSAADESGYTMAMSVSPAAATAATLGEILVTEGENALPTNVSFENDVLPIFAARGCDNCHRGGGDGKNDGDLTLNVDSPNQAYAELTEEISPTHGTTRVNLESPAESLILTMPSPEDPPDEHPNITFASPQDPDYLIILGWITEGALKN